MACSYKDIHRGAQDLFRSSQYWRTENKRGGCAAAEGGRPCKSGRWFITANGFKSVASLRRGVMLKVPAVLDRNLRSGPVGLISWHISPPLPYLPNLVITIKISTKISILKLVMFNWLYHGKSR